jgi:hypothetical protein
VCSFPPGYVRGTSSCWRGTSEQVRRTSCAASWQGSAVIRSSEIVEADDAITFIEWPERIGTMAPPDAVTLRLEHGGGDVRSIREITGEC